MTSRRSINCSPCALLGLALALPMLASVWLAAPEPVDQLDQLDQLADGEAEEDPLRGLWTRYDARGEGDPLRFWYFHGDGKGLYRYGKVGLANTHSFDYAFDGRTRADGRVDVTLRYRKTGESHAIAASIEREGNATYLTLHGDPEEPGARYRKVESDLDFAALARPQSEPEVEPTGAANIGDRIWIDYRSFATGGAEFHMYQLGKTAIDGRGVGWFHRGDFDDWSTESLTYRIAGDELELFFDLREEPNVTSFRVVEGERGRELVLDADPRDYWAHHRYRDGGRSFGSAAFDVIVGFELGTQSRPEAH